MPIAVAVAAAAIWFGPATPRVAFDGLLGIESREWIGYDLLLYLEYAERMASGGLPYRDFPFEYPPLSALMVAAPHALGDEPVGYRAGFESIVGALLIATAVATTLAARARGGGPGIEIAAGGFVAVAPWVIGHGLAAERLDVLPTMLLAFSVLAAARDRFGLAGAMAGMGVAAKLWPAVFLPPLLALAARRAGREGARRAGLWFAVALGVPSTLALILSPGGFVDSFEYHADRPLQVEALGATGLLVVEQLGVGGPYTVEFAFRSLNLAGGSVVGIVEAASSITLIAAVLVAVVIGVSRVLEAEDEGEAFELAIRTTLTAIVALIVFGKVLSPQFLLWLLPLPLLIGRGRWLALALSIVALVLTNAAFGEYLSYLEFEPGGIALFALRDLALLALLVSVGYPLLAPDDSRNRAAAARPGAAT